MKLVGNCHLCGKPAMQSCASCGLITCKACINVHSGICFGCAPPVVEDDYDDDY